MKLKTKVKKDTPKEPLHVRLRPTTFNAVIGQKTACSALEKSTNKAFLLIGPSGTGKTTLARILAKERDADILEVDAATTTGVEAMREVAEYAVRPRLGGKKLMVLVDECHMLSKSAWNSLLKVVEEPPNGLLWAFCTTEPGKVPETINTRCQKAVLQPVRLEVMEQYAEAIIKKEDLNIKSDLADLAAKQSRGSVRQMLMYLSVLDGVKEKAEAIALMQSAEESPEVIALVRYLAFDRRPDWSQAMKVVKALKEAGINPESIRITLANYVAAVAINKTDDAPRLLNLLNAFAVPYNSSDNYAPLLISIGEICFDR